MEVERKSHHVAPGSRRRVRHHEVELVIPGGESIRTESRDSFETSRRRLLREFTRIITHEADRLTKLVDRMTIESAHLIGGIDFSGPD